MSLLNYHGLAQSSLSVDVVFEAYFVILHIEVSTPRPHFRKWYRENVCGAKW